MTAPELFEALGPRLATTLEQTFQRRDLCVLSTRIAIDVGAYFGIVVEPLVCRMIAINRQFLAHVERGELNIRQYQSDGSWSVGIGFNKPEDDLGPGKWNGHMIAVADGYFGDFAVREAERPEKDIVIGPAVIGPLPRDTENWKLHNPDTGVMIEYSLHPHPDDYHRAPDWIDKKRRHHIVGALIREIRAQPMRLKS